jgi:hypothetical protein
MLSAIRRPSRILAAVSLGTGLVSAIVITGLTGCSTSAAGPSAEEVTAHRSRFLLDQEPEGELQTVYEVRLALSGELEHEHAEDADHEHADQDYDAHDHAKHEHAAAASAVPTSDTEPMDVLLVGHVGGLSNPWAETQPDFPFAKRQAVFFLADAGAVAEHEASGHVHAEGEACAFCAAHAADNTEMLAMVRFVDGDGKLVRVDAEELFDLRPHDTVVVWGSARVAAGGMMIIDADGLYVRR